MENSSQNAQVKHEESHVHFPEDQISEHDADIIIKKSGRASDTLDIHLGFLQFKHTYQVKFSVKDELGEDVESDPLQNLNVRVTDIVPTEDGEGHNITLEFSANKEKLQHEKVLLKSPTDSKSLTLALHARVLGKGKGTPSLKNGIHVVRVDMEDESELSDWQGFS